MAADTDGEEVRNTARNANRALFKRYFYASRPQDILTDDDLGDVGVEVDALLEQRRAYNGIGIIGRITRETSLTWTFEVTTKRPKYLKEIFFSLEDHDNNFKIETVQTDKNRYTVKKPYFRLSNGMFTMANVNSYMITVSFVEPGIGTYCQNLIFVFSEGPAIRRKLCIDVYEFDDTARLRNALEYMRTLCRQLYEDNKKIIPFDGVYSTDVNKDKSLCDMYKKQCIEKFFITSETLKFSNQAKFYKRRMHELITIEEMAREEQISRQNAVVTMAVIGEINLGKINAFVKYATSGELFVQVPLVRDLTEDTKCGRLLLRSCNSLLLQEVIQDERGVSRGPEKYEAIIVEKSGSTIYAKLSRNFVKRFRLQPGGLIRMYVEYVMNRAPLCDWRRAVDLLTDSRILHPKSFLDTSLRDKIPSYNNKWNFKGCQLNDKQQTAVAVIMTPLSTQLPPVLILGPYGTGKTSTIAQAIRILLMNQPQSKVILCTHSNSAADLYIKDYFDVWYNDTKDIRLKPIRIYYYGRMRNTVHPVVQNYCLFDNNGQFRDPTNQEVEDCRLIVTTLGTASCLSGLDYSPSHVIVDEAAQAFECEALACLVLANEGTRIVLAGDQMQLAPEVYSDLCRESGLGVSILERIHKTYSEGHPCRVQLCINYRSHTEIVELTSKLFYKHQIQPGSNINGRVLFAPVSLFACHGLAVPVSDATGFCNEMEAREIVEKVAYLRENWPEEKWGPFDENSICVLTHYAEQVFLIRKELRKRRCGDVSVERVLNVQGKQFAVVFVSIVRTRHCSRQAIRGYKHDYGFLTDEKLMNTAITRAKHIIGVFGDPIGLVTTGSCKKLWETYIDKSNTHGMNYFDYTHELTKVKTEDESEESHLNPRAREFVPRPNARIQYPHWTENVAMPIRYPVMHCVFRPTHL